MKQIVHMITWYYYDIIFYQHNIMECSLEGSGKMWQISVK